MDQLRVSFEIASHDLMPMVLEGLARHEGLAHVNEGVLEIDIVSIDSQHDDIVPAVPLILDRPVSIPIAPPNLCQCNHRIAVSSEPLDLVQCEILNDLGVEPKRTGAARNVFGIGTDFRVGVQQLHQLRFVDLPSPVAKDGPKRRCTTGIISDLTASVQKTELAHDTPSNSQRQKQMPLRKRGMGWNLRQQLATTISCGHRRDGDGCATNNAAAAVTASAVTLTRVFISNSLHKPAGHLARIEAWKAVRSPSEGTSPIHSLISINRRARRDPDLPEALVMICRPSAI